MAVPLDQEIRPQRLTPDHPDGPSTPSTGPPAAPPEQAAAAAPIAPPPYPCGNCRAAPTRPGQPMIEPRPPGAACVCRARPRQGTGAAAHPAARRLRPRRAHLPLARPGRTGHRQSCRCRSCLTLTGSGQARWHYEPPASPASAGTLAAIITHILGAPHATSSSPGTGAYRAFPGQRRGRANPCWTGA